MHHSLAEYFLEFHIGRASTAITIQGAIVVERVNILVAGEHSKLLQCGLPKMHPRTSKSRSYNCTIQVHSLDSATVNT